MTVHECMDGWSVTVSARSRGHAGSMECDSTTALVEGYDGCWENMAISCQ